MSVQHKKLIYFGWGTRDTLYLRKHWRDMQRMPFDGIGIAIAIDRTKPTIGDGATLNRLGWSLFLPRAWQLNDFRPAIADLKAAKSSQFTDNFLEAVISSSGQDHNFNWFDKARWKTITNNWRMLVTIAKEGGCKGILLDPEHYGFDLFRYAEQRRRMDKPFAEYAAQVRQRGRELMEATRPIFPDITLFCLFGHAYVWSQVRDPGNQKPVKSLEEAEYGLYPAFLDGMLEGESPRARMVDGYEGAYAFEDRINFERAYEDIKRKAVRLSNTPERYARQVQAGFGLWLDYGGTKRWNTADFTQNFFRPDEFERALRAALEVSDHYVWIYSHVPRFFPQSELPEAYLQAIRAARLARRGLSAPNPADIANLV